MILFSLIWADVSRYFETVKLHTQGPPNKFKIVLESFLFKPGFQAVLLYRLAHAFQKHTYVSWTLSRINQFVTSAEIEYNAEIGPGLFIAHPAGIVIGRGSQIGKNVNIYQRTTLGTKNMNNIEFPIIGDYVTLFSGATVLGNIHVGSGTVVGANSVLTKDVPENTLVIGQQIIPNKGNEVVSFEKG